MKKEHEVWCAKVIADNAQVPYVVKCDCKPKKKPIIINPKV